MSNWSVRKFKPIHLEVARLYFQGHTNQDIADTTGLNVQYVSQIINGPDFTEMLERLTEKTMDTILDIQSDAQAIAPRVFEEKVRLALTARDEKVRSMNCTDILQIAGHKPVNRVAIERVEHESEKFKDKSEEEIRSAMLKELGVDENDAPTVH